MLLCYNPLPTLNFRSVHCRRRYNISLEEERRLAFERLKVICHSGLVSIRDFRTNALNIFAAHEITAFAGGLAADSFVG